MKLTRKRLMEMAGLEEAVGIDFLPIIGSLQPTEKATLLRLSNNAIDKAKRAGFKLYVNLRTYGSGGVVIEFCVKHNHNDIDGKPEYHFMHDFKYKVERSVKINPKVEFDITTGQYDGSWDDSTIDTDTFMNMLSTIK